MSATTWEITAEKKATPAFVAPGLALLGSIVIALFALVLTGERDLLPLGVRQATAPQVASVAVDEDVAPEPVPGESGMVLPVLRPEMETAVLDVFDASGVEQAAFDVAMLGTEAMAGAAFSHGSPWTGHGGSLAPDAPAQRPGPSTTLADRALQQLETPDSHIYALAAIAPAAGDPRADLRENMLAGSATASAESLSAHFEQIDYRLADVREAGYAVPRLYVQSLPSDLADIRSVKMRKRIFIRALLPLVLRVNEEILRERASVQLLLVRVRSGGTLNNEERSWLLRLAERYSVEPFDWQTLLRRIDEIPPALAIAQAAEESGWGTSRFAREGNALFGQYTYQASQGIRPADPSDGSRHYVRAYQSLFETVRSYMHNLNNHRAYREFRTERFVMRIRGQSLDSYALAGKLERYSERGADYVKTIRSIIKGNRLGHFDRARLHSGMITSKAADRAAPDAS